VIDIRTLPLHILRVVCVAVSPDLEKQSDTQLMYRGTHHLLIGRWEDVRDRQPRREVVFPILYLLLPAHEAAVIVPCADGNARHVVLVMSVSCSIVIKPTLLV
jgi:hypothetical protein